jgi:hypothetical protein
MTTMSKRSLISESVAVIRIGVHPIGGEPDQYVVHVAPWVSHMTTIRVVPTNSKLSPYSWDEVLAPEQSFGPAVILGCLILPSKNHLKAGKDYSTK